MYPTAQLEKQMKRTMLWHLQKNWFLAKCQSGDVTVLPVEEHLEKLSLEDSSLRTDLGLCFCFGLGVLGFTRPCSSNISCCFLRRYSCFISSRRVFSSSLRKRSSSAFRLVLAPNTGILVIFLTNKLEIDVSVKIMYLASSRLSSDSASSCCLRSRASSAFFCCFSKNAALFLASSSSAFCSS